MQGVRIFTHFANKYFISKLDNWLKCPSCRMTTAMCANFLFCSKAVHSDRTIFHCLNWYHIFGFFNSQTVGFQIFKYKMSQYKFIFIYMFYTDLIMKNLLGITIFLVISGISQSVEEGNLAMRKFNILSLSIKFRTILS
jgi:hypothetical protein